MNNFEKLTEEYLADTISCENRKELELLLENSKESRELFAKIASIDSMLSAIFSDRSKSQETIAVLQRALGIEQKISPRQMELIEKIRYAIEARNPAKEAYAQAPSYNFQYRELFAKFASHALRIAACAVIAIAIFATIYEFSPKIFNLPPNYPSSQVALDDKLLSSSKPIYAGRIFSCIFLNNLKAQN